MELSRHTCGSQVSCSYSECSKPQRDCPARRGNMHQVDTKDAAEQIGKLLQDQQSLESLSQELVYQTEIAVSATQVHMTLRKTCRQLISLHREGYLGESAMSLLEIYLDQLDKLLGEVK